MEGSLHWLEAANALDKIKGAVVKQLQHQVRERQQEEGHRHNEEQSEWVKQHDCCS